MKQPSNDFLKHTQAVMGLLKLQILKEEDKGVENDLVQTQNPIILPQTRKEHNKHDIQDKEPSKLL